MKYSTCEIYADGEPYHSSLTIELSSLAVYIIENSVQWAEFQKFVDEVEKRAAELTGKEYQHE